MAPHDRATIDDLTREYDTKQQELQLQRQEEEKHQKFLEQTHSMQSGESRRQPRNEVHMIGNFTHYQLQCFQGQFFAQTVPPQHPVQQPNPNEQNTQRKKVRKELEDVQESPRRVHKPEPPPTHYQPPQPLKYSQPIQVASQQQVRPQPLTPQTSTLSGPPNFQSTSPNSTENLSVSLILHRSASFAQPPQPLVASQTIPQSQEVVIEEESDIALVYVPRFSPTKLTGIVLPGRTPSVT
jgi:hypothetical protein